MPALAHGWTLDDLHRLPDDGNKYEVIYGELFVTPAPTEGHENIVARLSDILTHFVRAESLGRVYHPRAVVRFRGSEAEPDLFIREERLHPASDWDDAPPPLLVVEVLSPTTRHRDLGPKRKFYLEAGAAEYWVIDPETRTVRVIGAETDTVVSQRLTWSPKTGAVCEIDLASVFDPSR